MPLKFERNATRDQVWLRAFLMGPTGSGKSRGALELAARLFAGQLETTLINTERGRGKMYADRYSFHYVDLSEEGDYSPDAYIRALDLAEKESPGGVVILDSVSHEWMGSNGILSQADRFGDWKVVRPKHNAWVERMMALNSHLIVTVRAKMKYEVGEEETGGRKKQVIRMLGVGPIQSDDLQYEFNLVGRFEQETHDVTWSGHVDPLIDTVSNLGDEEQTIAVAAALTDWLAKGNPPPEPPEAATDEAVAELVVSLKAEGMDDGRVERGFAKARGEHRGVLPAEWVAKALEASKARIAEKNPEPEPTEAAQEAAARADDPKPGEGEPASDDAEMERLWEASGRAEPAAQK